MLTSVNEQQTVQTPRFARGNGDIGTGRRYALEGDARPGDVLALAGGALVRDANVNGRVDGVDEVVDDREAAPRYGFLVDLRA